MALTRAEKFFEKVKSIHGDKYDYSISVYTGSGDPITIICPIHGEFTQRASKHAEGQGCPRCAHARRANIISGKPSKKRKTSEQFIEEARTIHGEAYDYSKVNYITNKELVTIICPVHGEFQQTPTAHITKKRGCPKCSNGFFERKTTKQFIEEARAIHGDRYDYIEAEYGGAHSDVTIICPDHGPFTQVARSHLLGSDCPKCVGGIAKEYDHYIERFTQTHGNLYGYDKTSFVNSRVPMRINCKEHGWFLQAPTAHYGGQGCPKCARIDSQPEIDLLEYIKSLGLYAERNNRSIIKPYELDIVVPEKKLAIEYCGLYWHGENGGKDKHYHKNKFNMTKEVGYHLITIFEDEWLEKPDAVKSVLRNQLGFSKRGVGARSLKIRAITRKDGIGLIEQNHLIGRCNGSVWIGAYDDDLLVAVMVFGNPTRQTSKHQWELIRFVTDGKTYAGVANRLFSYFVKNYNPTDVVSFSDNRWFTGEMYSKLGFTNDGEIPVDYFYTRKGMRYHKSSKRKSKLSQELDFDTTGMTESVMAAHAGYDRIWDCGKVRWVWKSMI